MLKSMTAYGRSTVDTPLGRFTVEVQSVNRRHLEPALHLPPGLQRFESGLRRRIADCVERGKVTLRLSFRPGEKKLCSLRPNLASARALKEAGRQIAGLLELREADVVLALLQKEPELLVQDEEEGLEELEAPIEQAVAKALEEHGRMRCSEGAALQRDIEERLTLLEQLSGNAAARAPAVLEHYRKKLKERLRESYPEGEEAAAEERLLREASLFADRADIEEELTRFRSHLEQFREFIQAEQGAVGKKLEFLLQELLREANTAAAKSPDVELSRCAVEMKTEIERIREQIQNVE